MLIEPTVASFSLETFLWVVVLSLAVICSCGSLEGCGCGFLGSAADSGPGNKVAWPPRADGSLSSDPWLNLEPLVDAPDPVRPSSWNRLSFTDESERDRLLAIRSNLGQWAQQWHKGPLYRTERFIVERWCGPRVRSEACRSGRIQRDRGPGTQWIELAAGLDPERDPNLSGIKLVAFSHPIRSPWVVELRYCRGDGDPLGSDFAASFIPARESEARERLDLGIRYRVELGGTDVEIWAPGLPSKSPDLTTRAVEAEVARLLESPFSLRETVRARLGQLRQKVRQRSAACARPPDGEGPEANGGAPDGRSPCDEIAGTEGGRERALQEALDELERRQRLIEERALTFHSELTRFLSPQ